MIRSISMEKIHTCIEKSVVIQATGRVSLGASLLSVAPLSRAFDLTDFTFDGVIQPFKEISITTIIII